MMSPAVPGCSQNSTAAKGRPDQGRPVAILQNTDAHEHSNTPSRSQSLKICATPQRERKETLYVIRPGHPARTLLAVGIGLTTQDVAKAAKLYDALMAARESFYRSRGRRVPTEAEIDAERYPVARPRKAVARV